MDELIPRIKELVGDQIQASLQRHFKNTTDFLDSEQVHSISITTFQNPATQKVCESMKHAAKNILFNRDALCTKAEFLLYASIMELFRFQKNKESNFKNVDEFFQLEEKKIESFSVSLLNQAVKMPFPKP